MPSSRSAGGLTRSHRWRTSSTKSRTQRTATTECGAIDMTEIIAEIGVNHDGSLEKAFKLVDAAIAAGADVVKTQLSVPELETSLFHAREHADMIAGVMLTRDDILRLRQYCGNRDIEFMCTPAEQWSLEWLVGHQLGRRLQ